RVQFRVAPLFDDIYASFKPIADGKGLDLVLNMKPENISPVYMGDPIRIRQVVGNLLSNAIKFTASGRVVLVVSVKERGDEGFRLVVTVSDSGPGIPLEEQERVFGEFTRLSGTEQAEGFGLGLSITRKLLSLMNGSMSLSSQPGKGSDFTVEIPLPLSESQSLPDPDGDIEDEELPMLEGDDIYCLLVDDDPLQLALTEELTEAQTMCRLLAAQIHTG
ncbi:protein containing ATP-binding region, ATPase-like domain protein, partial [gut metagenome]